MRLATITNWAYGATVFLTLVSGTTMLLASNAQDQERAAVNQRYRLDKATDKIETEVFASSDRARQYLNSGDPTYRLLYARERQALRSIEDRVLHVRDAGASVDEVESLKGAIRWADSLHDEQIAALSAHARGDEGQARQILFGAEYERELDRAGSMAERFKDRLDQRTEAEVAATAHVARLWKAASEIALGATGLLFLCVLYFVFKQRVLRPVLRLSDVVSRLAAQDYAVEAPAFDQIDEIGDMAQAISVFRENGLERQRLEAARDVDLAVRDLLARMTQRMQGCDTLLDLTEVVRHFVPQVVPYLAGRLYLMTDDRNAVVEACSWLEPVHSRREFPPMACWALRRGLPHRPSSKYVDVPCDHLKNGEALAAGTLCLPLIAQRETLGLLYFEAGSRDGSNEETPEVYWLMLAENIGLALSNLRLRKELREMALADALTGLANRRSLEAGLEIELAQADRLGQPISCLMIDVDHFKRFNDEFGHDAGDAVLREVGGVLKRSTRDHGLAFRYGGEEFLLLLPNLGPDQAVARAEEIRARIGKLRISHGGRELGSVTASVGIASSPSHCPVGRIVHAADAALLAAKVSGRDRVAVAQPRKDRAAA